MTPFLALRTLLIWLAGAAFVKLLEGHPAGIVFMGMCGIGSMIWLLVDLHNLTVAAAGALRAAGGG